MNIAALISGGVDSAVAVHLLCEQGYKPDLFYIKIGMDTDNELSCTAEEDIELATATARRYGLQLEIIDLSERILGSGGSIYNRKGSKRIYSQSGCNVQQADQIRLF